jgi:hypothetical protein
MDKEFNDYPELQLQEYEFTRAEAGKHRLPTFARMTELAEAMQYFSIAAANESIH